MYLPIRVYTFVLSGLVFYGSKKSACVVAIVPLNPDSDDTGGLLRHDAVVEDFGVGLPPLVTEDAAQCTCEIVGTPAAMTNPLKARFAEELQREDREGAAARMRSRLSKKP